jgi:hypothetical protein
LVATSAGDLGVDAAEGDAEQDEDDEEMPKRVQGEVPSAWRARGRAGTLSRRARSRQLAPPISLRPRPMSSGIAPEYFLRKD